MNTDHHAHACHEWVLLRSSASNKGQDLGSLYKEICLQTHFVSWLEKRALMITVRPALDRDDGRLRLSGVQAWHDQKWRVEVS